MGCYFNPPDEICTVARQIRPDPLTYRAAWLLLHDDEVLFGLFDRLDSPIKNCVFLFCVDEWEQFFVQVDYGNIVLEGLFALPRKVLRDGKYPWAEKEQEKPVPVDPGIRERHAAFKKKHDGASMVVSTIDTKGNEEVISTVGPDGKTRYPKKEKKDEEDRSSS